MTHYNVITIGAGPAGIISTGIAKGQNPDKSFLMLKEEPKGLVPCGIPYIFNALGAVDKNVMGTKPLEDAGITVNVDAVIKVDTENKTITTEKNNTYTFDKLIMATGSRPTIPTFIDGYDLENVYYIKKSYNYISQVFEAIQNKKQITVIGGGFIGAEVAEQLAQKTDKKINLIEIENACFTKAFSPELSEIATEELRKSNVNVKTNAKVTRIVGENNKVKAVELSNGDTLEADAVIMAVGYKPNIKIAQEAGLRINQAGAICIDNYLRTSANDVYAVGDCSETKGFITGRIDSVMLASTATSEARILGYNLFDIKIKRFFSGTLSVFSTEINGLAMAAAGLHENHIADTQIAVVLGKFSDVDRHPGTFADTKPLTIKLYASATDGCILGGEVWGGKSTGEIINIISLAIQKCVNVYELVSFQIGTHPLLTTAPTKNVLIKAAEAVIKKL